MLCADVIDPNGPIYCPSCLCGVEGDADRHRQMLNALAERARIGKAMGNDKAVCYPHGIDLGLRRLLDALRKYQIEVRLEIVDKLHGGIAPIIYDGHLRRVSGTSNSGWPDSLGLFVDVVETEPKAVLNDDDYDRIARISIIDSLVAGRSGPRAVWSASAEQLECWSKERLDRHRRDRRAAIWFLIHALILLLVIVGIGVPFFWTAVQGYWWHAAVWAVIWCVCGSACGATLGCWEALPDLSLLRGRSNSDQ